MADDKTPEQMAQEVRAAFDTRFDQLKAIATEALGKAEKGEPLAAGAKEKADEAIIAANEAKARLAELEQKMVRTGSDQAQTAKSMGAQVAASDEVKSFASRGAQGSIRVKAITSADAQGGALAPRARDGEIVGMPRDRVTIRQLLNVVPVNGGSVEYARQTTRTNAAAVVAEAALKPESNLAYELVTAPVRTIATWIAVSRQILDDAAQLQGEIDGELRYMIDVAEEAEILNGDGTGVHLDGLMANATAYAAPVTVASPTSVDILRLAMLQASLAGFPATGIVLNEADWGRIELTKTTEGAYLFANPTASTAPRLWGVPVVPSTGMAVDTFLVGAFNVAATLYDRMDTEVLISSEDRDNFIRNMLTVRAERREALAVKRPGALVTGDFGIVA